MLSFCFAAVFFFIKLAWDKGYHQQHHAGNPGEETVKLSERFAHIHSVLTKAKQSYQNSHSNNYLCGIQNYSNGFSFTISSPLFLLLGHCALLKQGILIDGISKQNSPAYILIKPLKGKKVKKNRQNVIKIIHKNENVIGKTRFHPAWKLLTKITSHVNIQIKKANDILIRKRNMKTLYVSDLDGTLLTPECRISPFTANTINSLVKSGMLFSFATARSRNTALKVTKGIDCRLPMIAYNGVFTADYKSGEILLSSFFGGGEKEILPALLDAGISPIVYSYDGKKERFTYLPETLSEGAAEFVATRKMTAEKHSPQMSANFGGAIFLFHLHRQRRKTAPALRKVQRKIQVPLSAWYLHGQAVAWNNAQGGNKSKRRAKA